ncbi:hypothetical protein FA95DRAFT_1567508 [Auriscalpium vulgare]|uniref:Uncharacterized protein n=1 Tax=Auriscalpium vulgare TaxID=40419 RepID=A0ACB8R462_9AGAM|nr:hypothetical protein FA95DRAFT_1567508 [Auriscalpium vulgare]
MNPMPPSSVLLKSSARFMRATMKDFEKAIEQHGGPRRLAQLHVLEDVRGSDGPRYGGTLERPGRRVDFQVHAPDVCQPPAAGSGSEPRATTRSTPHRRGLHSPSRGFTPDVWTTRLPGGRRGRRRT